MSEHAKEIETLVDIAVLGEQVDQFMRSDVGLFLKNKIDIELNEAVVELKGANAFDPVAVQKAQNKVWRAESLAEWISQAIMSGLRATIVLESREDD